MDHILFAFGYVLDLVERLTAKGVEFVSRKESIDSRDKRNPLKNGK